MRAHLVLLPAVLIPFLAGCPSETPALCDNGACEADGGNPDGSSSSGGNDGAPDVIVPPGCDLTKDPKDSPKCIASEVGIFVDATTGNDGNSGSKELPVKTIAGAQAKLAGRPRIYVCEGTYPESVKLTSAVDLFGGFACSTWAYSGAKPKIAPTQGVAALQVALVATTIRVADLAFTGAPASSTNTSSIAIFVHQSKVDFVRIDAHALDGSDGANATVGANYDSALMADDPKLLGISASGTQGGGQQDCNLLCTNGIKSTGGKGGMGGNNPAMGMPSAGEPGKPDRGAGFGGQANAMCLSVGAGGIGGLGNPGQAGTDGQAATVLGKLTDTGWSPSDGAAGTVGGPGQGGGGGGGSTSAANGAGGGGGCGGCGGSGGGVARGGGGSIAALVLSSAVRFTESDLSTQKAGNGGAGAAGQTGQVGGAGGAQTALGCQGGAGGKGGAGGASAGGAGGISVGVVYRGDKPTYENSKVTPGAKGTKGAGGATGNDGLDGVSQESLEVSL